ncbi:hypothetical protein BN903_103 [Halorubrum sp. AJ67]|nr:hypothetical protein BN903_103 [Halorubrum sp. AJ67]
MPSCRSGRLWARCPDEDFNRAGGQALKRVLTEITETRPFYSLPNSPSL